MCENLPQYCEKSRSIQAALKATGTKTKYNLNECRLKAIANNDLCKENPSRYSNVKILISTKSFETV